MTMSPVSGESDSQSQLTEAVSLASTHSQDVTGDQSNQIVQDNSQLDIGQIISDNTNNNVIVNEANNLFQHSDDNNPNAAPSLPASDNNSTRNGDDDNNNRQLIGRLPSLNSSSNSNINRLSGSCDNLLDDEDENAPRDKYKLICLGFAILGITTLLPWNFFITATDYWMYKFRNTTTAAAAAAAAVTTTTTTISNAHLETAKVMGLDGISRTPLQTFFESYLSIAANFSMLVSMLINSLYGQRFSQKRRLYVSLSVMLIVFTLTTIFVKIDTDGMQNSFFAITMVMVIVVSFFSAIFQAAIFGIVASFPNSCMHAMVNGQAVAGLLAVAIQILSMLNNTGPLTSGLWYFLASTIFLVLAIVCYRSMDNDYTRYYLSRTPSFADELPSSMIMVDGGSDLVETIRDCWQMAAAVIVSFWATLAVFPGVCVLVSPQHPDISTFTGRFYTTITTFLLFNCGDLAGRLCSTYSAFPARKKNLLLGLTVARTIIPFAILFCNVNPRHNTPVLMANDFFFPILNSLSALTNGYLFSSAMVMASQNSQKQRLELTGFVMATALGIGLTLGSISSTILLRII